MRGHGAGWAHGISERDRWIKAAGQNLSNFRFKAGANASDETLLPFDELINLSGLTVEIVGYGTLLIDWRKRDLNAADVMEVEAVSFVAAGKIPNGLIVGSQPELKIPIVQMRPGMIAAIDWLQVERSPFELQSPLSCPGLQAR